MFLRKNVQIIAVLLICAALNGLGSSAKQYHIPSFTTNWFKANEYCNSIGMQLVTIQSRAENDALAEYIRSTNKFNEESSTFWLGGTDLGEQSTWFWTPTGALVTYTNWTPGEPNNAGGNEHCIQIVYIPKYGQRWTWNDNDCKKVSIYFVCENRPSCCRAFTIPGNDFLGNKTTRDSLNSVSRQSSEQTVEIQKADQQSVEDSPNENT